MYVQKKSWRESDSGDAWNGYAGGERRECCIIKENQKTQNSHEHEMMHNEIPFAF